MFIIIENSKQIIKFVKIGYKGYLITLIVTIIIHFITKSHYKIILYTIY